MKKEYLVYIKEDNEGFETKTRKFLPFTLYQCTQLTVDGVSQFLVNDVVFGENDFNTLFENAHARIMRHFEMIGLLKDGKPISKTAFLNKAYKVKYGKGKGAFYTLFFYTHPKECMYRFSPFMAGGGMKTIEQNFYDSFINLVNGDMEEVEDEDIEFGNCGLPFGQYLPLKKRVLKSTGSIF